MDRDLIAREVAERLGCTVDKLKKYTLPTVLNALLDSEEKCRKLEQALRGLVDLRGSNATSETWIAVYDNAEAALSGKG